jgi:hypothetical protein
MSSKADETATANTYTLECVDCSFERTVRGGAMEVLDVCDAHQERYADDGLSHFVDFELEESA